MAQCSFCKDPVPAFDNPRTAHLSIHMDKEGHIHSHGDLAKKDLMQEMLHSAAESCGLELSKAAIPFKEVILNNKQRIGDSLMFTCAIRDFKRAFPDIKLGVRMTAPHIIDHNPYIDRSIDVEDAKNKAMAQVAHLTPQEADKQAHFDLGNGRLFLKIGPSLLTNQSNWKDWHFANAYRVSIEKALGVNIPQGESRPDIYFTQEEYDSARIMEDPYWVICISGEKGWGCKMYPYEDWQKFVEMAARTHPKVKFVQIGTKGDNPPRLQGPNVVDMVGKTEDKNTGIRDLFKLFLNAEGSIGLVSFHMHLSGALYKPCVVVAGGREPVSFTRYAGHQYLATDGVMPCSTPACWHCDIKACTNLVDRPEELAPKVPRCVDIIKWADVHAAFDLYYAGGRLSTDKPLAKPPIRKRPQDMGVNVVPTPVTRTESTPGGFEVKGKFGGLDWGTGAIDPKDWPFIEEVIKKNKVQTVLEFGAGLSTALISDMGVHVVSFETEQAWIDKVKKAAPRANINKWNGRFFEAPIVEGQYDLAFVDGPANGQNREEAFRIAANFARIVIVHDATREYEAKWEAKYLKPGFTGPIKGGKWCHMWIKNPSFVKFAPPAPLPSNPNKKRVRIVSTARGWGGCARSVTTIMKLLLNAGHEVEFVPFRHAVTSREFIDALKNGLADVKVSTSFDVLREHCDVLLVYADDYVWEFPNLGDAFSTLNADRKIMMTNFRLGGVGEIPWTKQFDRYLFLNSLQEAELKRRMPGADTAVFPPCVDLAPFFEASINYRGPIRIVRHNSQGDAKFDKNEGDLIRKALDRRLTGEDMKIHMLPGPSWLESTNEFIKYARTGMPGMIRSFLEKGNLFWYSLPKGYIDAGPRVILEAMAAGLPVIADNWGGAPDRVTPDTGWICDTKEEMLEIIRNVTPEELERKGKAARARALREFRPERWLEELVGIEYGVLKPTGYVHA